MKDFARKLIRWQRREGRHGLPWQGTRDPYRIWVAEIMLQQTRVETVIPYYLRFLKRFPDVRRLALADLDEVLRLWAGLGYYSRARNLHKAAQTIFNEHRDRFPRTREGLQALPGVGRTTASAIAAFAFAKREAILDGNVKRVLARHFAVSGVPGEREVESALWELCESLLPADGIRAYNQALMDLGATICTRARPACGRCPVSASCVALERNEVAFFPEKRPRKKLPRRNTAMLIVLRHGQVLLERRPPSGIWGGLWSLPEMAPAESVRRHCADRLGCEVEGVKRLEPLAHGFTHFTLHIRPIRCAVTKPSAHAAEPGTVWLPLADVLRAAVPAPVKKLLSRLIERA